MPIMGILSAGIIGALLGPWLRAIIATYSVPVDSPPRHCYPARAAEVVRPGPTRLIAVLPCSGRCPACRDRIGPPPGSIEILTGTVFGALALRITSLPVLAGLCWLAACGIALAVIDATTQRLPNILIGAALTGLLIALAVATLTDHHPTRLPNAALGGITLFAGYTALAVFSGGMGFGDCKLAAVLGAALAWFSWTTLLTGTVLSFLIGALPVLIRRVREHARGTTTDLPFGPALLLGTFAALMLAT